MGYITAADLATYATHGFCDLLLKLQYDEKGGSGARKNISGTRKAYFESGKNWEAKLRETLKRNGALLDCQGLSVQDALEKVLEHPAPAFVVLVNLQLSLQSDTFKVGTLKPDFVAASGDWKTKISLRIVEAKASKVLKVSHQIQVGLYARSLQASLQALPGQYSLFEVDNIAEVWMPRRYLDGPATVPLLENIVAPDCSFSLELVFHHVDRLLQKTIPSILQTPVLQANFCFSLECQGCPYEFGCEKRVTLEGGLSSIPDLRAVDRSALKSLLFTNARAANAKEYNNNVVGKEKEISTNWNSFWQEMTDGNKKVFAANETTDIEDLGSIVPNFVRDRDPGFETIKSILEIQNGSPIRLQAVQTQNQLSLQRPCASFPRLENSVKTVEIFFSADIDPRTDHLCGFGIHSEDFSVSEVGENMAWTFVRTLGKCIERLMLQKPPPRVSFFCADASERKFIIDQLLNLCMDVFGCSDSDYNYLLLCVGTLVQDPAVLAANFDLTPRVLPTEFLWCASDRKRLLKAEAQEYLTMMGGEYNAKDLKDRVIWKLDEVVVDDPLNRRSGLQYKLPRIVAVLEDGVRELLAVPIVGYTTFEKVAKILIPSRHWSSDRAQSFQSQFEANEEKSKSLLLERARTVKRVVNLLRQEVGNDPDILVNTAPRISCAFFDYIEDTNLSKLLFLTQFEMVCTYDRILRGRLQFRKAPVLQYDSKCNDIHRCRCLSGMDVVRKISPSLSEYPPFDYILVDDETPHYALEFDDLSHSAQYGHNNLKFTTDSSLSRHVRFASFVKIDGHEIELKLKVVGGNFPRRGQRFRLYERFVDVNSKKLFQSILATENRRRRNPNRLPLFVKFLSDAVEVANAPSNDGAMLAADADKLWKSYKDTYELIGESGKNRDLLFHPSQHAAFKHILQRFCTVVWGPPGNGKTHSLALTTVLLFTLQNRLRPGRPLKIIMTAFTHNAISTFLEKFNGLRKLNSFKYFANVVGSNWDGDFEVIEMKSGGIPSKSKKFLLVVGTVWGMFHAFKENRSLIGDFDVLIMDEASQIPVSHGSISFQAIDNERINLDSVLRTKRLIISGDHHQFPPILQGSYPRATNASVPLFGSILDCFRKNSDATSLLTENFRFVKPLSDFTSRLYNHEFDPQMLDQQKLQKRLDAYKRRYPNGRGQFHDLIAKITISKMSMVTATFQPKTEFLREAYQVHLAAEAQLVKGIVDVLLSLSEDLRIFVIVVHRVQRSTITNILPESKHLKVDTAERMQGAEADVAIVCFSFTTHAEVFKSELDFIYEYRRLNVSLSRPRSLCILLGSDNLLNPPLQATVNPISRMGVDHLLAFKNASMPFVFTQEEVSIRGITEKLRV